MRYATYHIEIGNRYKDSGALVWKAVVFMTTRNLCIRANVSAACDVVLFEGYCRGSSAAP